MIYIGMAIAIVIIGALATFMVGEVRTSGYAMSSEARETELVKAKAEARIRSISAAAVTVLALLATTFGFAVKTVDAGTVAVVYEFGEIVGQKAEGLQFVAPWQSTRRESTKVQRVQFENVETFSNENQDVFLIVTLNYRVSPDAIQGLYRNVGPNWFDTLVQPRLLNYVKQAVVQYPTVEVAPNRAEIREQTEAVLREDLAEYSVEVVDVLIDNIRFNEVYLQAIENKQIAEQQRGEAENRIGIAEAEAAQEIARARGEAQSAIIRAEGEAEANRLVAESLTSEVLQYRAIDKLADDIEIALIPSGQGVILDPASLLGQTPSSTGADE